MKRLYVSPSIEVVEINFVDIVTTSEANFKKEWLDPLSIDDGFGN